MRIGHRGTVLVLTLLLAPAAAAWAGAECNPDFVTVKGKQVAVRPSGGDDTANLQCAIDLGTALGPGASVRLATGDFSTAQLLIKDLRGSLRGAGQGLTVLRTPGYPLPIARPCVDDRGCFVDSPPAADNPYPVLIAVLGRDVTVSDLSIVADDGLGTETYLGWMAGLSSLVEVLDSGVSLRLERVTLKSGPWDCGTGVCAGDAFQGVAMWRWFWGPGRLTGSSLVIDDSDFDTPSTIIAGQLDNGRIVVTRSHLANEQPNGPLSVFDLQHCQVRFAGNHVNDSAAGPAVSFWSWVTAPEASVVMHDVDVHVANNTFVAETAVGLDPGTLAPGSTCLIANNDVSQVTGVRYTLSGNPCRVVAGK